MFILIERYIDNLTIEKLNAFAISKGINLSDNELNFSFKFVKNNWKTILSNHGLFDIDKYKNYFSEENFTKIKLLIKEYTLKYGSFLK